MGFKLKFQKYDWRHFVVIPFQCDPLSTIVVGIQKLLTGLSAVFLVPVMAKFIDLSIKVAKNTTSVNQVLPWFLLMITLVGWRRISYNLGRIFTNRMTVKAEENVMKAFTDKRARIKYSYIEDPSTWDLINRVCTNVQRHISEMLQRTYNLVLYIIRIIGILIIVYTQIWWVGLLITVLTIPLIFISLKGGKGNYSAQKAVSKYERRYQYISDVLCGRDTIDERTLFSFSDDLNKYWFEQYETARKIKLKSELKLAVNIRGGSAVTSILSTFIVTSLVFPTISGEISYGMFIAISAAVYDLVNLMGWEMTRAVTQISRYTEYMKDFTVLANLSEDEGAIDFPDKNKQVFESLEFRNVSFKYPGVDTFVLNNLNMKLEKGIHYAFVGVNGSGKTTITKLIMGLYDNYDGEIILNGKDIKNYAKSQIKAMFSGVYQDFAKYQISVENNIGIGNINNMENSSGIEDIKKAADEMNIYNEIEALPDGFKTILGKIESGGVDISGGQWQRIAMARVLVNPAQVRILDEPTAALDPISESRIYENFEEISKGITTIFISHRLGSTKIADKILVIDKGMIVEEGNHEELMNKAGAYKNMYDSQRSWYQ